MRKRTLFVVLVVLSACGRAASPEPTPGASAALPKDAPQRIAVLVLENKEYDKVIGNADAPFINGLAQGGLATNFFAITHPSLPNYLALLSGQLHNVGNCTDCHFADASLPGQLEAAHISWKAYIEGYPGGCFVGSGKGRYAKKHNPFIYFDEIASDAGRCAKIVGTDELANDIASKKLPRFTWITPDMCHSAHDCSIAEADHYVAGLAGGLLKALGPRGLFILTFDEGSTKRGCCGEAAGGRVATIALFGKYAGPGKRYDGALDHYSILRLIEDVWKLQHLGAADQAPSMAGMLNS